MDKGFYSTKVLNLMPEKFLKFAIGGSFYHENGKETVREIIGTMESPANAIEVGGRIYHAITKIQTINNRRAYLHVYYDKEHDRLLHKIIRFEDGLMKGTVRMDSAEATKYFPFLTIYTGKRISSGGSWN